MANVPKIKIFCLPFIFGILSIILSFAVADRVPCQSHDFGEEAIVCVCNTTYCDTVEENTRLPKLKYSVYTSSKDGKRLEKTTGSFDSSLKFGHIPGVTLTPNPDVTYQTVFGFGGAITDSTAINVAKLPVGAQRLLMEAYFGKHGIEYNVVRVNMGGCDFSTRVYSYDDFSHDFNLTKFALAAEDIKYKIPLIKQAQNVSNNVLRVFASPWSAPAWMKTNNLMYGQGSLRGQPGGKYYKTWAQYYIRFLQEYKSRGVPMWGLTVLNEPQNGFIYNFSFTCMGMSVQEQTNFIVKDLGPALDQSAFSHIKLMILDSQRFYLPDWAQQVFSNPVAEKYVSGIGVHWYWDFISPASLLTKTHQLYPQKFILGTEACVGDKPWEKQVDPGSWSRGEMYAHDIIEVYFKPGHTQQVFPYGLDVIRGPTGKWDLNHFVVGWTDWNIALDMQGGPNWAKNFVDSPVIVDAAKGVFYKQPMFYAMGHFSKFVRPGCKRIDVSSHIINTVYVQHAAFLCDDNSVVVVLNNVQDNRTHVTIRDPSLGDIRFNISGHSMHTVTWWR